MKLYLRTVCLLLTLLLTASAFGCGLKGIGDDALTPHYAETTVGEEPPIQTEQPTESLTEALTEELTEALTEELTEVITEELTEAATETATEETTKEVVYYEPGIPDYPSFGGDTVKILVWKEADHGEFVFDYENRGDTVLQSAIYKRNVALEEMLNINVEFVSQSGDTSNAAAWNNYLINCVGAAAREYDFIAGSSIAVASNAASGLLINLLDINGDGKNEAETEQWFMQPQWFESTNHARIGSSLYYATGTHSPNALSSIYACYVNRDLLKSFNLEDPAELVDSLEWTFDKFFEMCRGVYSDKNGNGIRDRDSDGGDLFSHITSKTRTDAWYYATGARYCTSDKDGAITVSPTYNSDKVLTAAASLAEHFGNGGTGFISDKTTVPIYAFADGDALFMTEILGAALEDAVQTSEGLNYSIIPLPKYDKSQEKYYSVMNSAYSLFAVPADAPDRERAITVLQHFASVGYGTVPGAFYSEIFDGEFHIDSAQTRHFDIICASVVYDHGRLFAEELIGQNKEFRDAITGGGELSLLLKHVERIFGRRVEELMRKFK